MPQGRRGALFWYDPRLTVGRNARLPERWSRCGSWTISRMRAQSPAG